MKTVWYSNKNKHRLITETEYNTQIWTLNYIISSSSGKQERLSNGRKKTVLGALVTQSFMNLTLAQVMNSPFVSSSPISASVLTDQSPEPVSDSVSMALCPSPTCALSLSLKNK